MKKLTLAAGAALGYVLGTRAGREQYEKISTQATRLWQKPGVQKAVGTVKQKSVEAKQKATQAKSTKTGSLGTDPTTSGTVTPMYDALHTKGEARI